MYIDITKMGLMSRLYIIETNTYKRIVSSNTLDYIHLGEPITSVDDDYDFHKYFVDIRDNLWITSIYGAVKILDIESLNRMETTIYNECEDADADDKEVYELYLSILEKIFDNIEDDNHLIYLWKNN